MHTSKVLIIAECLKNFESWRVAVLKFCDDLIPANIVSLQKHMLTDEVFVLISGTCALYSAGIGEIPGAIEKNPWKNAKTTMSKMEAGIPIP